MGNLTVALLGSPDVRHDGRPVAFRARKALALLAYLAAGDGARSREEIMALLWPKSDASRGRASLRSALAGLRGALGEPSGPPGQPHLLADGGTLSLAPGPALELDLRGFEAAHALARATPRTGELAGDTRREAVFRLRSAAGSYRGEFLKGFSLDDAPDFDLWLDLQREAWRGRAELVHDRLSKLVLEDGEHGEAISVAARWTELAPLSEEARRRLVEVQLAAGDGSGALSTYAAFRSFLKRELGTEPGPEIQVLASRIDERTSRRAPRQKEPVANRVPEAAPGGARVLSGTPFTGRSEEFGVLTDAYRSVLSGETRAVALVGDAGIGKTRLAEEFFSWAERRGADVLRGRVHAVGGLPYGVFIEALRPRVERERAPDDLLEDVWLAELARLLPEIRERYPDLPPPEGEDSQARSALLEATSRLVAAFASKGPAPLVLFLDDLHWASQASQDALRYAARRWAEEGSRVLVVLALRPEVTESLPSAARWLSDLGRELPVSRLELGPLAPAETLDLLRALLGEASGTAPGTDLERLGRWLHEETGGQPFFLAETLKLLSGKGILVVREGTNGTSAVALDHGARDVESLRGILPEGVREVILARLSRLGRAARKFLVAGAVLGDGAVLRDGFPFEKARLIADLDEDEALAALDEARMGRLLGEGTSGAGDDTYYAFTHEKIRDVVYTEAGAARRRVFHRRALEALQEARDVPPAELARHAEAAGAAEAAFRHLLAAGDSALKLFAAKDAAARYERARRLLGDRRELLGAVPVAEAEHLYASLGRTYEISGDPERARLAYEDALAHARRAREPTLECAALNHLASLAKRSFDLEAAATLLEEARRVAEAAGHRAGLAETEWNLAETAVLATDPHKALPHAEKALSLARELGLTELSARSLHTLALTSGYAVEWERAARHAEESRGLYASLAERAQADAGGLPAAGLLIGAPPSSLLGYRAMECENLSLRSISETHLGLTGEGIIAARAGLEIGSRINNPWSQSSCSVGLAIGLSEVGEYEEALLVARRGVTTARALGHPVLPLHLFALGFAQEALLRLEVAHGAYLEALELSGGIGRSYELASTLKLCVNRALAGDWEAALVRALEAAALRGEVSLPSSFADFARHLEVEALLRGGHEERARHLVHTDDTLAERNRRYRLPHLRALAAIARWKGDAPNATRHLQEAETLAEELALPGELWRISADLGELHEARGEREPSRRAFERSAQILTGLACEIDDDDLRSGFLAAAKELRFLKH